ncbi:hypothetical protein PILCRDRAFT_812095 [Piloderma croceum F 1598]|uniref:BTB domain-containing protein n=1 Tax=Piloderma croceum (strain F 1598) TaxID=765440 RepID=A0A0C3CL12_PILCF|nr:hypothetical protein PILCRDRAFT_812095 [Piloderma croceum F 1598]
MTNNRRAVIRDATGAPFDDPDADIIIRSSDNVDFRVFKMFLSYASPIFRDMFALPQVSKGENSNEMRDGLPIVQVTEEKETLEKLLSMCYPMAVVGPPELGALENVHGLLEAAIKYNVEGVEKRVRGWLVAPRFLADNPLRVFAIACRYKFVEEAKVAARSTLSKLILTGPYGPELEFMTAGKFFHLLQYHAQCIRVAKSVATSMSGVPAGYVWNKCSYCNRTSYHDKVNRTSTSPWFLACMQNVTGALADRMLDEMKKDELMQAALAEGWDCQGCHPKVFIDLRTFSTCLWKRMDEVISVVKLNVEF